MNSKERMAAAMQLETPDRVPLMCQPSWGFVLKQVEGLDPVDLWHNRQGAYSRSFCQVSERFHFDGVLIPAVGLAPLDESRVSQWKKTAGGEPVALFASGDSCTYCLDDLPRYQHATPPETTIEDLDPDRVPDNISYLPPSTRLRMWLNSDPEGRVAEIRQSRELTGDRLSIHGSVYAPEDYLIDLLGIQEAFLAMMTHPELTREILLRYAHATCVHVGEQIEAGADSINFSAPWTGQNFISREMFEEVVAPAHRVVTEFCAERKTSGAWSRA